MFVPKALTAVAHPVKARLLIVPNNTGKVSDDPLVHLLAAMDDKRRWRKMATDLNAVLLIPVFPRPASNNLNLYTCARTLRDADKRTGPRAFGYTADPNDE